MVHKLAVEAEEKAVVYYKEVLFSHQKNEIQLKSLMQYRNEYTQQLNDPDFQQLNAMKYRDFHRFINQINKAIAQQQDLISQSEKIKTECQKIWHEKETRRKAIEMLINKKGIEKTKAENAQEQKNSDEFVTLRYTRTK